MAEMLIQSESLTSIADKIRVLKGITDPMSLDDMDTQLDIPKNNSDDLTASGATVTVPAGYYATQATKSVATATQATPSVSIDSEGNITASATQTAGYVSAGTKTGTKQLTTQAAKTITPTKSSQTAVVSGVYTTGAVTVEAIPNEYVTVQTKTGTFTSVSNRTGTTVNCGFKPDFVTITEKLTYDEDSNFNTTISLDSSFNFIDCTDNTGNLESISFTVIRGTDYPYDLFVRRTDNGFMVSIWKMTADMTSGEWWGNKTFTYYAYKIT